MPIYLNNSGNSGVASYEEADDGSWISVTFVSGQTYTYTPQVADVATMIALARSGSGLSAYIARNHRHEDSYRSKRPADRDHYAPARQRRAELKARAAEAWARLRGR